MGRMLYLAGGLWDSQRSRKCPVRAPQGESTSQDHTAQFTIRGGRGVVCFGAGLDMGNFRFSFCWGLQRHQIGFRVLSGSRELQTTIRIEIEFLFRAFQNHHIHNFQAYILFDIYASGVVQTHPGTLSSCFFNISCASCGTKTIQTIMA